MSSVLFSRFCLPRGIREKLDNILVKYRTSFENPKASYLDEMESLVRYTSVLTFLFLPRPELPPPRRPLLLVLGESSSSELEN